MARLTRTSYGGLTIPYMKNKLSLPEILEYNIIYGKVIDQENKALEKQTKKR